MKSLEERLAQRAEQRELLSHGGVIPQPSKAGEVNEGTNDNSNQHKDQFEDLTIAQLKEWVKSKGGEVPAEKQKRDDILEYTRNYAAYLEANPQSTQTQNTTWSQQ